MFDMTRRMDRINVQLRQQISQVLATELNDPRLSPLVSVTRVEASGDLRLAKVFVSVLGEASQKEAALAALGSAAGFVHRSLRKSLALKTVPTLQFQLDESIAQGAEMLEIIRQAVEDLPDTPATPENG